MTPETFFSQHKKIALAYSGGTDSAYLLFLACKHGCEVHAFYAQSAFQPSKDLQEARQIAAEIERHLLPMAAPPTYSVTFHRIFVDVLSDAEIVKNPTNRCYFCKKKMFLQIKKEAADQGCDIIIDGTNASDDADDRPGMKALKELGILSPLREWGMTKEEIRRHSNAAGLSTWNKPAYACLATRIPAGMEITPQLLQTTEHAESTLSALGFSDFRIRFSETGAKIQLCEEQFSLLLQHRKRILEELKPYYSSVTLDLEVRT